MTALRRAAALLAGALLLHLSIVGAVLACPMAGTDRGEPTTAGAPHHVSAGADHAPAAHGAHVVLADRTSDDAPAPSALCIAATGCGLLVLPALEEGAGAPPPASGTVALGALDAPPSPDLAPDLPPPRTAALA